MLLTKQGDYSIHSLSSEEFNQNKKFFLDNFDKIASSIKLPLFSENEANFFTQHPINSFLYVKHNNKIVAIHYNTPHRDYQCYKEYGTVDLTHWGNNYIQVHKDYQGKGFGYLLTLLAFKDIKQKGGKTVSFYPNRRSISVIHHVTVDNNIGNITPIPYKQIIIVNFGKSFLNIKNNLILDTNVLKQHKHKKLPKDFEYFDYYFYNEYMSKRLKRYEKKLTI